MLRAMPSGAGPADETRHRLPFTAPYDWPALLGFLSARAIPGVEAVDGARYRRTVEVEGRRGRIEVAAAPGGGHLLATILLSARIPRPPLVARLRRLFDLDAQPAPIAARLSADPRLAPLVAARPGLRVPGAWDPFELAVRAILGQQITVAAATRLAGRLVAAHGTPVAASEGAEPELGLVFPPPERLASADLARLGMPRARAAALAGLAAAAGADGSLFASGAGLADAVARLRRLPGVGEWTAQYVAMRALREADAFPAADVGLLRALADGAVRPTPAQLLARAEAWRPWRAYAVVHLWTAGAAARPEARRRERAPRR
jgi:AraC family transcriptional regulator of adaptative response / DNA-3-methyladenine glycosylase II